MDEIRKIYEEAFGTDEPFDSLFFENFGSFVKTYTVNGKTVSILFLLPCKLKGKTIYYLYAAATKNGERGKGYMTAFIKSVLETSDAPVFLKPEREELVPFYEKVGFYKAFTNENAEDEIIASAIQNKLNCYCDEIKGKQTVMISDKSLSGKALKFNCFMM